MDNLEEIKKGLSDIKLSVIIGVLVAFFVSSVFVWVIISSRLNDILKIVDNIDDKTLDYTILAD